MCLYREAARDTVLLEFDRWTMLREQNIHPATVLYGQILPAGSLPRLQDIRYVISSTKLQYFSLTAAPRHSPSRAVNGVRVRRRRELHKCVRMAFEILQRQTCRSNLKYLIILCFPSCNCFKFASFCWCCETHLIGPNSARTVVNALSPSRVALALFVAFAVVGVTWM